MGILNTTPDSFYDGGRFADVDTAVAQATDMIAQGTAIIDVGGASSRPGAATVPETEELRRVVPVIAAIKARFPDQIISIDTWRASVARAAVAEGASIVNDISAGSLDPELWDTVAELRVPYILMHMQGTPQTMQAKPEYSDIATEVLDFFIEKTAQLREKGVEEVVIDPGFGFGKTIEHNYDLLAQCGHIQRILQRPLLVGVSRKSMIYKLLETTPEATLPATSALHLYALQQGAHILRVHDARAARDVVRMWGMLGGK
jgi:dihydropteroate synthase